MTSTAFRNQFLGWAEPRGLELPTDTASLRGWVSDFAAASGQHDEDLFEDARSYFRAETGEDLR